MSCALSFRASTVFKIVFDDILPHDEGISVSNPRPAITWYHCYVDTAMCHPCYLCYLQHAIYSFSLITEMRPIQRFKACLVRSRSDIPATIP